MTLEGAVDAGTDTSRVGHSSKLPHTNRPNPRSAQGPEAGNTLTSPSEPPTSRKHSGPHILDRARMAQIWPAHVVSAARRTSCHPWPPHHHPGSSPLHPSHSAATAADGAPPCRVTRQNAASPRLEDAEGCCASYSSAFGGWAPPPPLAPATAAAKVATDLDL
jgi:hypothetical protein